MERCSQQGENEAVVRDTYLLRKRRRMSGDVPETSPYIYTRPCKRKSPIERMPTEVVLKILSYLSNDELAKSARLINRRLRFLSQHMLNKNFKNLKPRLEHIRKVLVDSMQHTQAEMEIKYMCRMLRTLELLIFNHSVIYTTCWRYIYFSKPLSNICMYAGSILDMYDAILRQCVTNPHELYSPGSPGDYAVSDKVKDICASCKAFALYFDRVSEMPQNTTAFCSGSKILDILDSATDVSRIVENQNLIGNNLKLSLKYNFTNSWFVAFDIPEEKPKQFNEEQRAMYMRLRRIVNSHSEMTIEYHQYEREKILMPDPALRIRKPVNSVYTGYGEVGKKFFYYGVMNEGAFFSKFEEDEYTDVPFLGLCIYVNLKCPLQLAPKKIIEYYEEHRKEFKYGVHLPPRKRLNGVFELQMRFICKGAGYARLPTHYSYYLKDKK